MIRLALNYATRNSEHYNPSLAVSYIDAVLANRDQLDPLQEYEAKLIYDSIDQSEL